MRPLYRLFLFSLLIAPAARAQTKVFKAVAQDMEQQFETILQDGKPVGYLMFMQLEKASADSFNYRIDIMDENLNDIGNVEFRQKKLNLKGVSFEQDVLCLVYVTSDYVGKEFKNLREFLQQENNNHDALFFQFLGLDGKFIATNTVITKAHQACAPAPDSRHAVIGYAAEYKHTIQLRNLAGKGFACFYGDESKNSLLVFNAAGKLTWQKQIHDNAVSMLMLTSGPEVSLLIKAKDKFDEGGFAVLSYNAIDTITYPKFLLKDRRGNSLKPLVFDNDPVTGKPFVSGLVIDSIHGNRYSNNKQLTHGPYSGLFTINLNGHTRGAIQAQFSYWNDGSQTFVNKHGYYSGEKVYADFERSFRDYQGNTWFVACGVHRRIRWAAMAATVATLPLIVPPLLFMGSGPVKFTSPGLLLLKQDHTGKLALANKVDTKSTDWGIPQSSVGVLGLHYYPISNSTIHTDYLVVDDEKNIQIYNVNETKVARTIPHQLGDNLQTILPAKEGYMMVYAFNKKEKTTRLSIEAL